MTSRPVPRLVRPLARSLQRRPDDGPVRLAFAVVGALVLAWLAASLLGASVFYGRMGWLAGVQ